MTETKYKVQTWDSIHEDKLSATAFRKALHGSSITVAHFDFRKGNKVALHHHANDQVTIVASGAIRMDCGGEILNMKTGDMVHVPPDVPHANEALEDTIIIEVFSPVREDWIKGDDSYLRQK
jgi:quercetin dioxygenase-like cupin family protein